MGKGKDGRVMTKRKYSIEKKSRTKNRVGIKKKITKRNPGRINDPNRVRPKSMTHLRDKSTIKRLKMYNDRPIRNRKGKILRQKFMSRVTEAPVVRIRPDRRWFGNTKIISQKQLQLFRHQMKKNIRDPFTIVLKSKKIPYALLDTNIVSNSRMKLLQIQSFDDTFGKKMKRKKPSLGINSMDALLERAQKLQKNYDETLDERTIEHSEKQANSFIIGDDTQRIFLSGQSNRIRSELYKVIDSSDVILQIIDARDPMGTRSPFIEKYIKTNCKHKHLILVLNKIDLIPVWCTKRWLKLLSAEYPTIAFKASKKNNNFGKGALISLLRQFRLLYKKQYKTISVGLFGYPNVGKSSIINVLVGKKVCSVAAIPGQTKVWQYVALFDKFYLIDCPGVVYVRPGENSVTSVLRSVVRIECIEHPEEYIVDILSRVRKEYIQKTYEIEHWTDSYDFMSKLARKRGKLFKDAEPDYHCVAVSILHDWQRGRLPWFVCPPFEDDLEYEYKLRQEKMKIELTNKKVVDGSEWNEFQPVSVIKDIQLTHEFLREDLEEIKDVVEENVDQDWNEKYCGLGEEMKKEVLDIKVSNPLKLSVDDPIIIAAKMRVWDNKMKNNVK